jgi:hypothetical protein
MSGLPMSVAQLRNLTWPLASFAVLAAMTTVQNSHVAEPIEVSVRFLASTLGLAGIPTLLVLAFRNWSTKEKGQLSPWRYGLGVSSIVVLSTAWASYWAMALVPLISPHFSQPLGGLEWLGPDSSLLGFVLGFTLRGAARAQAISAALLMWASIQASIVY